MTGLFITGTDTGVGKTFVTCRIARQLRDAGMRVGIYKPVCTGAERDPSSGRWIWQDLEMLSGALESRVAREVICPQRFVAPLAPPEAARREGKTVNAQQLHMAVDRWQDLADVLLIEGIGGWKCPLTDHETIADLARRLGYPVLIVAANRLGTLNHTLLTAESVHSLGLHIAGILLNTITPQSDETAGSNAAVLHRLTKAPILGPIPFQDDIPSTREGFTEIDWQGLIGPARPV